jgi:hypothetical protein
MVHLGKVCLDMEFEYLEEVLLILQKEDGQQR